jgi:hypothetical protein
VSYDENKDMCIGTKLTTFPNIEKEYERDNGRDVMQSWRLTKAA